MAPISSSLILGIARTFHLVLLLFSSFTPVTPDIPPFLLLPNVCGASLLPDVRFLLRNPDSPYETVALGSWLAS
jgi:hypothetical protein